jgi:small subunit ribosomal protein S8
MFTDPISDYLTRLRNAIMAGHRVVEIPASKVKKELTKILFEKGYILNYKFEEDQFPKVIKIAIKYHPVSKQPAITTLQRASSPGLRQYAGANDLPRVLNGLGVAVISTSHGLMTDKEARQQKIGGEVICYIS